MSRRRFWAWVAAAGLHALVIALFLISFRYRIPEEPQSPPGVSVVFENGGGQKASAPLAPQGPNTVAQAPPTPLPEPPQPAPLPPQPMPSPLPPPVPTAPTVVQTPPPEVAQTQPDVRLMPDELPVPTLPPAPTFEPLPPPHPAPARPVARPRPRPPQKYMVMNNMSFGSPSAAPPPAFASRGLNLDVTQSEQADNGQELTIKGDAGADWDAALNQWVEDHKYYPDAAVEQNQQGYVRIRFVVDRVGNVTGLRLLSGSGSPFLDQAWLGLFRGAQLPPFPPDAKDNNVTIDATMHFELIR